MEFTAVHDYDHPIDEVFATFVDFDLVRAKYEALGHESVELLERSEHDGAVTLRTRRVVPLDVPGFAKKFLQPKNPVVQTDTWSAPDERGVRTGTFTVEARGVPVTVQGTLRLEPTERGCRNTITTKVECKVPLVGGRIAEFVGGDTRKAVAHEETWTKAHLSSR